MALNEKEQKELVRLLGKLEFPLPLEVYYAWCLTFGIICTEVAVLRQGKQGKEIFLSYREDRFFKGWHIPGRTHLPIESIESTLNRTCIEEVEQAVTKPIFFGWFERTKGTGGGESPRGNELSLLFTVRPKGKWTESNVFRFFPLTNLPKDVIPNQIPIFDALRVSFLRKDSRRRPSSLVQVSGKKVSI